MNTRNFLYNTALIFGLAVTAPSFADEPVNVDSSNMTQQEREAYRTEKQSGMTPEQRAERQESRSHSGGEQGQGSMSRDGSGSGGQYGRNDGGGGHGRGGR